MVMDRHGKLILRGLHGLELRVPYSGAWSCGLNRELWDKQRAPGFWDLLSWDGCSEWVYRRTSEDILIGMLICD